MLLEATRMALQLGVGRVRLDQAFLPRLVEVHRRDPDLVAVLHVALEHLCRGPHFRRLRHGVEGRRPVQRRVIVAQTISFRADRRQS